MSFLLKYGDDFSMEYSCPRKRVTPGFTMDFFYAVDNSCTARSHDCVRKEKGGMESGSSSYNFFRSSEFSPHVNTGSKISLFQSFNSYVVAKCKFNDGVFRYLTSMFP